MNNYETLLTEAEQDLKRLRAKITATEKLIAVLRERLSLEDTNKCPKDDSDDQRAVPGRLRSNTLCLFRLIENEGKSVDTIVEELKHQGIQMARAALVAKLAHYRRDFEFVDNPEPGLYRLSGKGRGYLNDRYPKQNPEIAEKK